MTTLQQLRNKGFIAAFIAAFGFYSSEQRERILYNKKVIIL